MRAYQTGLTLIEIMVTLAIVGLLTAVALPNYNAYVMRGRLAEAFSALATVQPNMEQYWNNGRTFVGFDQAPNPFPPATANFTYTLTSASNAAYVVTATGQGRAAGFAFTINQSGNRATTLVPSGWTANSTCWVDRKGGVCTQ